MVRFAAAVAAIAVGAHLASALVVDLDCGNTLVSGKGNGDYSNVCVRDQTFGNSDGQNWNFFKSKVTNTKFNAVTFKGEHNFENVEWSDVEFNDCKFEGTGRTDIKFNNGTMKSVTFSKCTFDASAKMTFQNLGMDKVTFKDCTFLTDTTFKTLTVKDLSILKSTVGGFENSFLFESASADGVVFIDSSITSNLRFHSSKITGLQTKGSTTAQDIYCGKITSGKISEQSTFIDANLDGLKAKNLYCGESSWTNMKLTNALVLGIVAFNGAKMTDIKWNGVKRDTSKGVAESCGLIDMSYGTVAGGEQITGLSSCNATFRGVKFTAPIDFEGLDVSNKDLYSFKDAEFSQTCIGNVSCVALCLPKSTNPICKCGSNKDSTDCSKKGSNVNGTLNEGQPSSSTTDAAKKDKKGSCFPADSTVITHDGKLIRMEDLEHSQRIAIGGGRHSEVFFFGHRSAKDMAPFVHIKTSADAPELRLSPGHYLYANGKLVTARSIVVGDKLETVNGRAVTVTSIRSQLARGLYAPATLHGNLAVDGIVVSSYTDAVHPRVAHTLLSPLRVLHHSGLKSLTSRFSLLYSYSGAMVAKFFGLAGPAVIERI
jgi:uncharacterized protein YjbI with pentapeptide repeats